MKYLIAGLGNIGPQYELTRHNIGFLIIDQLADKYNAEWEASRHAEKCEIRYKGRHLHLIKPSTYMNQSGKAIKYWLQQLKITQKKLLVITDDHHLPFGKLRLRPTGSDAGHNGLKNIQEHLGGTDYPRLRFGIGDNFHTGQMVDYVLSPFNEEEFKALPDHISKACEVALSFTTLGIERTMNQYN